MKVFCGLLILTMVLASPNLRQQVGESCKKDPNFVVQVFDVNPWPLVRVQDYVVSIGGVFLEKEHVDQIYIGLKDGKGFWHYTYQTVNKDYAKNAVANFTVNLQAPSDKGSYTSQMSFHRSSLDELACWQYYYLLGVDYKMKFFMCLVVAILASSNLRQQIGESCKKDPSFVIDTFDVNPWPFARTEPYTIQINGVFADKIYVEQIYIGTKDGIGFWHYTYQSVQKEFTKGSAGNFTVQLQGPSDRGSYISQIQFHHYSFDSLACWQYYYVV